MAQCRHFKEIWETFIPWWNIRTLRFGQNGYHKWANTKELIYTISSVALCEEVSGSWFPWFQYKTASFTVSFPQPCARWWGLSAAGVLAVQRGLILFRSLFRRNVVMFFCRSFEEIRVNISSEITGKLEVRI